MEFPWILGPPDGRYLLRAQEDGEPEHVVVIDTLAASRTAGGREGRGARRSLFRRSGNAEVEPDPEPEEVSTTRVTVIDPISLSAENQARAWLADIDRERDLLASAAVVNRVLHAHRIATADPYVHEVDPAQALTIRAGWGEGEQVADGRWLHAQALRWKHGGRRSARPPRGDQARPGVSRWGGGVSLALRPQERLAELLGARGLALLCEELALRARLDLDLGRSRLATLELDRALDLAASELRMETRPDLEIRIAELEQLHTGVAEQAAGTLAHDSTEPDEELVTHALERLEAALRARSATGFSLE